MNEPEQDDYTPLSEEVVHEPKCHRVDSMNPEHAICTCRPATIRTYPRGITAISRPERPKFEVEHYAPVLPNAARSEFYAAFTHPSRTGEDGSPLTVSVDIDPDGRALLNLDDLHPLMEAAGFELTRPGWLDNPPTQGHESQVDGAVEPE